MIDTNIPQPEDESGAAKSLKELMADPNLSPDEKAAVASAYNLSILLKALDESFKPKA
jgi:hypothetical protein